MLCGGRVRWARDEADSLWEELHMQGQALARAGRWSLALLLFITSTAAAQVRISGGISGRGGIRGGKQDPIFVEGNAFFLRGFPKLDYIKRGAVVGENR
jgi:hypothetical protein